MTTFLSSLEVLGPPYIIVVRLMSPVRKLVVQCMPRPSGGLWRPAPERTVTHIPNTDSPIHAVCS